MAELHNYEALLMEHDQAYVLGGGNGKLTQYMIDMARPLWGKL